uniref:Uncharacterized protein n=1 Tax=Aegilops tauschii subsp. strangulata TaxID=200361 RepID=A0A453DGE4_AEGTS
RNLKLRPPLFCSARPEHTARPLDCSAAGAPPSLPPAPPPLQFLHRACPPRPSLSSAWPRPALPSPRRAAVRSTPSRPVREGDDQQQRPQS